MDTDLVRRIIDEAVAYNVGNGLNSAHFVFHGGEPLLASIGYFSEIVQYQNSLSRCYPGLMITNSIQTNGYLLDDDWNKLFLDSRFSVGVSIDGPTDLNSHYLSIETKEASDGRVLNNVRRAMAEGLPVALLSVITNSHIGRHREFYNFLKDSGIRDLGLCFCYGSDSGECVNALGLGEFLTSLFDEYFFGNYELRIREFDALIARMLGVRKRICTACGRQMCGSYPTIYPDGKTFFCDSIDSSESYYLGNVCEVEFAAMLASDAWKAGSDAALLGITACRECELFDLCGGGCFRHDQRCFQRTATRTYFCDTYKLLIPHVASILKKAGYAVSV